MLHGKKAILLLILFLMASVSVAEDTPKPISEQEQKEQQSEAYLRIQRDEDGTPQMLQTSVVRFVPSGQKTANGDGKLAVDLVSAVHIADKSYYEKLNREFAKYDVVLYELVAPPGAEVPKNGSKNGGSPVSFLQRGMKDMLELEFQLDLIDYEAKNLIHADMSPEEFAASMKQKGESVLGIFLRMMGHAMAQQGKAGGTSDAQLLAALFNKNRALALKRVMAEQFQDMDGAMIALEGPDGSTLISERNKVALKVLREQIDKGKKKIAIFYGGGHMPDIQKRLRDDFELVPGKTRWLDAWDMK